MGSLSPRYIIRYRDQGLLIIMLGVLVISTAKSRPLAFFLLCKPEMTADAHIPADNPKPVSKWQQLAPEKKFGLITLVSLGSALLITG